MWYYYKLKKIFILIFKLLILLKILSIYLDYNSEFFPYIFKDQVLSLYFSKFYCSFKVWLKRRYFYRTILFLFLFFYPFYWFFLRITIPDVHEIKNSKKKKKKKKKKKEELKNKEDEKKFYKKYSVTIKQKNLNFKKRMKKLEKKIKI